MRIPGLRFSDRDVPWKETRVDGISWLPLWLSGERSGEAPERDRGGGAFLIRMAPGKSYAAHRHVGTEEVLVLQGGYEDEFGVHVAGDFVHYPAGTIHSPRALGPASPVAGTQRACVLYAVAPGGIEILDR